MDINRRPSLVNHGCNPKHKWRRYALATLVIALLVSATIWRGAHFPSQCGTRVSTVRARPAGSYTTSDSADTPAIVATTPVPTPQSAHTLPPGPAPEQLPQGEDMAHRIRPPPASALILA